MKKVIMEEMPSEDGIVQTKEPKPPSAMSLLQQKHDYLEKTKVPQKVPPLKVNLTSVSWKTGPQKTSPRLTERDSLP